MVVLASDQFVQVYLEGACQAEILDLTEIVVVSFAEEFHVAQVEGALHPSEAVEAFLTLEVGYLVVTFLAYPLLAEVADLIAQVLENLVIVALMEATLD